MKSKGLVILVLLLILLLCVYAHTEEVSGNHGTNLHWQLNENGELTISGNGSMDESEASWKPYARSIKTVVIENGVTTIANEAFKSCIFLEDVYISEGVTTIGNDAFNHCYRLKKTVLPSSLTDIAKGAFYRPRSFGTVFNRKEYDEYIENIDYCFYVNEGSYAEKYVKEHGYTYHNGKALFLGVDAREIAIADSVIDECIKDNMSEKEKAKALHDWIIYHSYYDTSPTNDSLLVDGCGVCGNYTDAYSLLLAKAGIANARIDGNGEYKNDHNWNLVRIDGIWYHVDVTWDDPGNIKRPKSGRERSKYFMLTDKQMRKDHTWDESLYVPDMGIFYWGVYYPEDNPPTPMPTAEPTPVPTVAPSLQLHEIQRSGIELKTVNPNLTIGDHVAFGHYEQDGNKDNGMEEIEWIVLDVKETTALLISKFALDNIQYDQSKTGQTWEKCSLRKWLNKDFLNVAFSRFERKLIVRTTVNNKKMTDGGNNTKDYIYILNRDELDFYLYSENSRKCKTTKYAENQKVLLSTVNGNVWWWVRSPKDSLGDVYVVTSFGEIGRYPQNTTVGFSVRPVLWVRLQ